MEIVVGVIAVVGTLAGAIVSGAFQHKVARRTEHAGRVDRRRSDRVEAVTALACAAADHRRAMWMRGDAALAGASEGRLRELRAESHATRSAVTRPLVALRLHITDPEVRAAADAMVAAVYALRDALTDADLAAAREAAVQEHDAFVDTAARYLATA